MLTVTLENTPKNIGRCLSEIGVGQIGILTWVESPMSVKAGQVVVGTANEVCFINPSLWSYKKDCNNKYKFRPLHTGEKVVIQQG